MLLYVRKFPTNSHEFLAGSCLQEHQCTGDKRTTSRRGTQLHTVEVSVVYANKSVLHLWLKKVANNRQRKIKLFLRLAKHDVYGRVEAHFHVFFTSILKRGELSDSFSFHFSLWERCLGTHRMRGWMGPHRRSGRSGELQKCTSVGNVCGILPDAGST